MEEVDLRVVAGRLRVDSWTAEVVTALRQIGVRSVLLKGPAIARWLYPNPARRPYVDVDLMVGPADVPATIEVLGQLGYERHGDVLLRADESHSRPFERPRDNAAIDLHFSFHGMAIVSRERAWTTMSEAAETIVVAGANVEIPAPHVRAMNLVLHLSPQDESGSKAMHDLITGLERLPTDIWKRAAELARSLGIDDEFGHRLSLAPSGDLWASRLGVPTRLTARYEESRLARDGQSPPGLGSLLRLAGLRTRAERLLYVYTKLFPPTPVLGDRLPFASRGRGWLTLARFAWLGLTMLRLPRAVGELRRLNRGSGRSDRT